MVLQIFGPIVATVDEFLSYALLIVSIMIIYYIVKLILVGRPGAAEREAADEERREKFTSWAKEKKKKMDKGSAGERKRNLVSPIKENVVQAIEACSEAIHHIDKKLPDEANDSAKKISRNLHHAWSNLRSLRRKVEKEERDAVHKILVDIEAKRRAIKDAVISKIPPDVDDPNWDADARVVRKVLFDIRASLGDSFKKLEKFHE